MTFEPHQMALAFGVLALLVVLGIVRSVRKLHASPDAFDLRDLLMENGKASKAAFVMMGAFAATTWFFVYYTLAGKMTEGYFGLYAAAWIAPVVTRLISRDGASATTAEAVTTTATTTTLTTPVKAAKSERKGK